MMKPVKAVVISGNIILNLVKATGKSPMDIVSIPG